MHVCIHIHVYIYIIYTTQDARNRTLAVHERVNSRFLVLSGSLSIFTEITGPNILVYYDLVVN